MRERVKEGGKETKCQRHEKREEGGWGGREAGRWEQMTSEDTEKQHSTVVKYPPADIGAIGGVSSIPGSGRSPGGGHGNSLQYSFFFFNFFLICGGFCHTLK